jgi:UDP-N-acetylglucosamine acyltransferase
MGRIHPTAVIDPRAEIPGDAEIGAYCVIDGPVRLGAGNRLYAHVTLLGDTTVGSGNVFFPGCVVGAPPQDLKHDGEHTKLVIGDRNHVREHVTLHPGTVPGGGVTRIGSGNLFMVGSHVAHDCQLGDDVVLANHVLLAGHIRVGDRAVLNGACAAHHFTTIGRLSYVGGLTRITQDVHPFTIVEGHPARIRACNSVGMQRAGVAPEDVEIVRNAIFSIFISEKRSAAEAVAQVEQRHPDHPLVAELLASIRASQAGRQGRAAERPRGRSAS